MFGKCWLIFPVIFCAGHRLAVNAERERESTCKSLVNVRLILANIPVFYIGIGGTLLAVNTHTHTHTHTQKKKESRCMSLEHVWLILKTTYQNSIQLQFTKLLKSNAEIHDITA